MKCMNVIHANPRNKENKSQQKQWSQREEQ